MQGFLSLLYTLDFGVQNFRVQDLGSVGPGLPTSPAIPYAPYLSFGPHVPYGLYVILWMVHGSMVEDFPRSYASCGFYVIVWRVQPLMAWQFGRNTTTIQLGRYTTNIRGLSLIVTIQQTDYAILTCYNWRQCYIL